MPFRDVIGHRRLVALLSRAVSRGTLPPSLILAGPSGVGKRLIAVATAQALNCPSAGAEGGMRAKSVMGASSVMGAEGAGNDACGTCPTCTRIARNVHPDVLLIEPGENGSIKIDQVRDLIDRSSYRPFEGARRVVIIDEADALVPQAQNALLKTLEEPPPSSVFVLITSRPDMLLPTVLSRCPRLRFRALALDEVFAALVRMGRSESEARKAAAAANGSIGLALDASGSDLEEARDVAGRALIQAASTSDPRRRLEGTRDLLEKTGSGGAADRDQLAMHLRAMAALVRDVELLATAGDPRGLANADAQPLMARLGAYRGERGVRAFSAIDKALAALAQNAGVKVVADWVMLEL